jgi:hypothetical protein
MGVFEGQEKNVAFAHNTSHAASRDNNNPWAERDGRSIPLYSILIVWNTYEYTRDIGLLS